MELVAETPVEDGATAGEINISIHQGATLIQTFTVNDNTYQAGKFGFYNYSQSQVVYSGFTRQPLYTPLTITLPETSVTGAPARHAGAMRPREA